MDDLEPKQPNVVALSGAQLPADHGLASLGLLMQLGGSIYAGLMSVMALTFLFTMGMAGGRMPGLGALFVVLALSVVRSAFHRSAGNALVYGHPGGPLKPLKTYIWLSFGQTFVTLALLSSQLHLPSPMMLSYCLMLLAWPTTLLVLVSLPRIKRLAAEIPMSEDKGFEGASVYMVLFGAIGTLISGFILYMFLQAPAGALSSGPGMLILGAVVMLFIRGIFHFLAGARGARGAGADEAVDVTQRYYNFGIISSWICGGVFLLITLMSAPSGIAFIWVSMFVYLLLAWPLIIRRFFAERQFADMLAGDQAPLHTRAPDMGLTALGWLMLATGVMALAQALPAVLDPGAGAAMQMGRGGGEMFGGMMSSFNAFAPPTLGHSPWWMIGLAAVQLWAAIELVRMSPHHKIVGTIYGAVAIAVAFYVYYPVLKNMKGLFGVFGGEGIGGGIIFISMAMQLVMPVGALILLHRKHTASARARVRLPDAPV